MIKEILIGSALALSALSSSAVAAPVNIDSYDNGWYSVAGLHGAGNNNTITGICCGDGEHRSWYSFDLSSLSNTVVTASITFYANGNYISPDASETYQLNDYSGSIAALTAGGIGLTGIFDDLGDGNVYGSYEYFRTQFDSMVEFTINLSAAALADINTAMAGDGLFALGGMLTTLSNQFNEESIFSSSSMIHAAYLTLNGVPSVPEPAPLALLGLGLLGLGMARKRRA